MSNTWANMTNQCSNCEVEVYKQKSLAEAPEQPLCTPSRPGMGIGSEEYMKAMAAEIEKGS